ncbi:MAG: hypothetical protein IPK82_30475 [Polyangiaceae bacterium]|nr:hypothetical protein [Polyangiaceae bacterium]
MIALANEPVSVFAADTPQDRAEAKRLYSEGKKLRGDGKHADALDRFKRAHDLMPTPVTRLELARELDADKQLVLAHRLLVSIQSMPVTSTETQKGKAAREEAKALEQQVAQRIPKLKITLVNAAEPEVFIDEQPVSKELLTAEIQIDPGVHKVVARDGTATLERSISLVESESAVLELPFPVPEPPKVEPTAVEVPKPVPTQTAAVVVPKPDPIPEKKGISPLVPVGLSVGGVGIVTGLITGAIAASQVSTLQTECLNRLCPPSTHNLLTAHQALTTTSTIAFIVGGAAAGLGAVAWIVDLSSNSKTPVKSPPVAMQLQLSGTGFAIRGAW